MKAETFLMDVIWTIRQMCECDPEESANAIIECHNRGGTVHLFGNGASASIAAHTATDLTKMCGIRAVTYHDHNLVTCFVNDYGAEYWMRECINKFVDDKDLVILISSSGESKNVVYAADACYERVIPVISLTGFAEDNALNKAGDIKIWVNSKVYNVVEAVHWTLLAAIIEDISGRNK